MPGQAISQYIDRETYDAFKETTSVFRHDFAQYMGMLHSWMTLIQVEVEEIDEADCADVNRLHAFHKQTNELCAFVESSFQETMARLHPTAPELENKNHEAVTSYLETIWDQFYRDFSASSRPQIESLHKRIQQFTETDGFDEWIEKRLGEVTEEPINDLILRPFDKMLYLLTAENFDRRIADVLDSRSQNQTLDK
ncbi:MAG: hypothetical protein K8L99_11335 [Anaerolineae bacterium]|nr:hypothetical protein [Anaerolineae bacterium]